MPEYTHTHTHTQEPSNNRIQWIDIAKGLGIFFIVLGHVFVKGNFLRQIIFSFHVPLFFIISGLTFSKKDNQKEFIKKQIKKLYVPYIVVSLISIFIYLLSGKIIGENVGFNAKDIFSNIFGMIYANSCLENMVWNRPLWFIPAFIVVLVLTNIIEQLKSRKLKNIIAISITALGMVLSYFKIYLPFQMETAFSMLIWEYIGINCKDKFLSIAKSYTRNYILYICIFLLMLLGIFSALTNSSVGIRLGNYGNIFLYFVSALCINVALIFVCINIKANKWLEKMGQGSLTILLWHKFPILFFQKICPGIKGLLISESFAIQTLTLIFVAIISVIMCVIFDKLILQKIQNILMKKKSN